jgi:hypothetical protein
MFTPSPFAQAIEGAGWQCGQAGGCPTYGIIPNGAQWIEPAQQTGSTNPISPTPNIEAPSGTAHRTNAADSNKPSSAENSQPSERGSEELPAPVDL